MTDIELEQTEQRVLSEEVAADQIELCEADRALLAEVEATLTPLVEVSKEITRKYEEDTAAIDRLDMQRAAFNERADKVFEMGRGKTIDEDTVSKVTIISGLLGVRTHLGDAMGDGTTYMDMVLGGRVSHGSYVSNAPEIRLFSQKLGLTDHKIKEALEFVYEDELAAVSDPSAAKVAYLLKPAAEMSDYLNSDIGEIVDIERMILVFQNTSSILDVDYRVCKAFARLVQEFKPDGSLDAQTVLGAGRYTELQLRGLSEAEISCIAANALIVLGRKSGMPGMVTGQMSQPTEMDVALLEALGIDHVDDTDQPTPLGGYILADLLMMIQTINVAVKGWHMLGNNAGTDFKATYMQQYHKALRKINRRMQEIFASSMIQATQQLNDNHNGVGGEQSSHALTQLVELERRMIEDIRTNLAPIISEYDMGEAFEAHHFTFLGRVTERWNEEDEQRQREARAAEIQTDIAAIEEPFSYRSRRLRSYQGGTELLRHINLTFERRGIPLNDEARRTLAMMMLDSENAPESDEYFRSLHEARHAIEHRLAHMQTLGVSGHAVLTDILRWVDESVDAGFAFNDRRLEAFVENYYLSSDQLEESSEQEDHDNQLAPNLGSENVEEPAEATEELSDQVPEASSDHTASRSRELVEEYFLNLEELLEGQDLGFSDVAVFPPGARKIGTTSITEIARNVKGFVDIDPRRLEGLIKLKDTMLSHGKHAQIILTAPTRWSSLPYFALFVSDDPERRVGVCILENVVHGTATYAFPVDGEVVQSWEELAAMTRSEVEDFGGVARQHPNRKNDSIERHYTLTLRHYIETELARLLRG